MREAELYYSFRSPWQRWVARLLAVGVVVWLGLSLFYALTNYYLLGQFVLTPSFGRLAAWQAAALAPWIGLVPFIVWLAIRIPPLQRPLAAGILAHMGIALVIAFAHMYWFGFVSISMPAYPSMFEMSNALNHFARYVLIVDLLLYTVLVATTINITLQGLRATPDGLLRSSRFSSHAETYFADPVSGIESRHAPVLVYDPFTLRILAVNSACTDVYGYPPPELTTMTLEQLIAHDRLDEFVERLERAKFMSLWVGSSQHVSASGQHLDIEYINQRVLFHGAFAMLLLVNDVTEEIAARRALAESERKATELRVQLADARLRALKLQLKPHFLFNLLNTISMMIRNGDHAQAQQVVTLLGEMFRNLLDFEEVDSLELARELKLVELYLELQRFRFEDRMLYRKRVDERLLDARVPAMILQPIFENAVKHGIARTASRCRLDLDIRREGDMLVMILANDFTPGHAGRTGEGDSHGIGVQNTIERVRAIYGDRGSFELVPEGGRMQAILKLPLDTDGEART